MIPANPNIKIGYLTIKPLFGRWYLNHELTILGIFDSEEAAVSAAIGIVFEEKIAV